MSDDTTIKISAFTRRVINKEKTLENTNRVIKANKNLFLFFSKGDKTQNFNGDFKSIDGKGMWCRQLAAAFALRKKLNIQNYHDAFQSPNDIPFLNENHYDHKNIAYTADSYYLITLNSFGDSLHTLSQSLKSGECQHMLLTSENHIMAISLEHHEKKALIAKFYDPNTTTAHKQIWFSDTESIKKLKVSELLSQIAINTYFVNFNGVLMINPEINTIKKATQYRTASDAHWTDMLHFGLDLGISSWIITALTTAFKDNANPDIETLLVKNDEGYPGLYLTLYQQHIDSLRAYMRFILNTPLTNGKKVKLLSAKNKKKKPGLKRALENGYYETVKVFMHEILQSKLSNQQKVGLLAATDAKNQPGILAALENNQYQVIELYYQTILQSTLAPEQKAHLLRPLPQEKQTLKRKYMPDKQQEPPRKIPRPNF